MRSRWKLLANRTVQASAKGRSYGFACPTEVVSVHSEVLKARGSMKSKLVQSSLFFVVLAAAVPAPAQQNRSNPRLYPVRLCHHFSALVELWSPSERPGPNQPAHNIPRASARPTRIPPPRVTQRPGSSELFGPSSALHWNWTLTGIGADGVATT